MEPAVPTFDLNTRRAGVGHKSKTAFANSAKHGPGPGPPRPWISQQKSSRRRLVGSFVVVRLAPPIVTGICNFERPGRKYL